MTKTILTTSLLMSFISFLSEDERERFAKIALSGKEKRMRDAIVEGGFTLVNKGDIMRDLKLTITHFDKVSNRILHQAYAQLAGSNELEQLNFLSKKFMFKHLFHQIRHLRGKIKSEQMVPEVREKYYRAFFDFSINVPAKYFNEAFVLENSKAYLACVTKDYEERELEVKSKLLFARLNVLTQKAPDETAFNKILQDIKALEKKCSDVKSPEVKSILMHVWVNYYRMADTNWEERSKYIRQIQDLYGGLNKMPLFEKAMAQLHEAEMLYERDEFQKAFQAYTKVFAHFMPMLRNQFHHFARWIELAIILKNYDDAHRLLETLFKVYVVNHHETNGVIGSLLYAQLHMMRGEYEVAFQYLSLAKSLNSIHVYFHYEVKLRILETLYFAFSGDYDFVSRLSARNTRYIQIQGLSLRRYKYAHFFFIVKDFRTLRQGYPKNVSQRMISYMEEFNHGYDKIIGTLTYRLLSEESFSTRAKMMQSAS